MGYEYELKTNKDTGKILSILESEWIKKLSDKDRLVPAEFPEEIIRCTLLHGYDAKGNDGFSFCDPIAPVGLHEVILVSPLWDEQADPYIHIYCHDNGVAANAFFSVTKIILEDNSVKYSIKELED